MKTLTSLLVGILFILPIKAQQGFVVDHNHTDLSQIPDQWITTAKSNLKVRYFRRSHGSQLDVGGMAALRRYSTDYANKYNYNSSGANGAMLLSTLWNSLDFENSTWVATTESFLNNPANADINVIMWAWSSDFFENSAQDYVDDMEALIAKYGPGGSENRNVPVTFVFQTACGQRSNSRNSAVYAGNMLIRNHCTNNNRILFDFNDLECYDPDGNYFGDGNPDGSYTSARRLNDDCAYISSNPGGSVYSDSRNWGIDWMNNNPSSELTQLSADNICITCEHSMGTQEGETKDNSRLHCVLKGRAAWWLWAKLAGWQQSASSTITSSTQLSEANLNNAVIGFGLSGDSFADDNLQVSNFQLNGAPTGTTIQSVTYSNSHGAQLVLAFDGTDFDANHNFSVSVSASELAGSENLISNNLLVEAIDEDAPYVRIESDNQLTENNLETEAIHLELFNSTFADATLLISNFELLNEPSGCLIDTIIYQTTTTCLIELSFDNTDFDTDITNFRIVVNADELSVTGNLQSNALTISAIIEEVASAKLSASQELSESNLNGSVLSITLTNETFNTGGRDGGDFTLLNKPSGLTIETPDFTSDTEVQLPLIFDGTDFTEDILDFSVLIDKGLLAGTSDLVTDSLTINADVAQALITNEKPYSIKLFPNPGDGRFNLQLDDRFVGEILVKIINLEGKCVYEEHIRKLNVKNIVFDLQNLRSGNYFFVLNANQNRFVKTLIIE